MRVFSISAPDELLDSIDEAASARGYSGRSDFVRAALRDFLQRLREEQGLSGAVNATVTLCYDEARGARIAATKHEHSDILQSMVHTHTPEGHTCLEVLILRGPVERVRSLVDGLRADDGANLVQVTYV